MPVAVLTSFLSHGGAFEVMSRIRHTRPRGLELCEECPSRRRKGTAERQEATLALAARARVIKGRMYSSTLASRVIQKGLRTASAAGRDRIARPIL